MPDKPEQKHPTSAEFSDWLKGLDDGDPGGAAQQQNRARSPLNKDPHPVTIRVEGRPDGPALRVFIRSP
jgi:hypothetical protein